MSGLSPRRLGGSSDCNAAALRRQARGLPLPQLTLTARPEWVAGLTEEAKMERNDSNRVAIAILVAAVLVAAAVVYLGRQMAIGSDEARGFALIGEHLKAPGGALSEEAFNARVE